MVPMGLSTMISSRIAAVGSGRRVSAGNEEALTAKSVCYKIRAPNCVDPFDASGANLNDI